MVPSWSKLVNLFGQFSRKRKGFFKCILIVLSVWLSFQKSYEHRRCTWSLFRWSLVATIVDTISVILISLTPAPAKAKIAGLR